MSFLQQPDHEGLLWAVTTDIHTHPSINFVYVCVYYEELWRLRCSKICVYKHSDEEDGHKTPCVWGPIRVHGSQKVQAEGIGLHAVRAPARNRTSWRSRGFR